MQMVRKYKIAVLGSSSEPEESVPARKAFELGAAVARHGGVLLTGGCPGFPHAAVMGAASEGGLTVAVSPAMNTEGHISSYKYPVDSQVLLFTGMGTKGRNVVLIRSADACLFVGGGMGTLNEFTIAFDDLDADCAIGVLTNSGGLSDEYVRLAAQVNRGPSALLIADSDPNILVEKIFSHILSKSKRTGF